MNKSYTKQRMLIKNKIEDVNETKDILTQKIFSGIVKLAYLAYIKVMQLFKRVILCLYIIESI